MRDIEAGIAEGNERARLAMDMYEYRILKYIGAYSAVLGGVDVIVIRVAVSEQPECVLQLYSAEPQLATFHKTVHVVPLSYSHPFTIDAVSSAIISSSSVGMTTT